MENDSPLPRPLPPLCRWVFALAALKLLVHFLTNGQYGYHRDELYFLACGEHLDWGYVDHAPMIAWITAAVRGFLGDSLFALRLPSAFAGAVTLVLAAMIARRLGGSGFAQTITSLCVLIGTANLRTGSMLHIPSFEPLIWTLASYLTIATLQDNRQRGWLWVGVVAGIGLLLKHTMLLWGFGLVVGLLCTSARKAFKEKWLWCGGALTILLFLPNLIWQYQHGWPTVEFVRNLNKITLSRISPLEFAIGQVLYPHPFCFPIWITGLVSLFRAGSMSPFRLFGWSYVAIYLALNIANGKLYYIVPIYPLLLAVGSVVVEQWTVLGFRSRLRPVLLGAVCLGGLLLAPLGLPIIPIRSFDRYAQIVTGGTLKNIHEVVQDFFDMHGWEHQVSVVAEVYRSIPAEDRNRCCIIAGNYGQAGAIDFFGPRHGLPKAISTHMSYHLWGPRDCTAEVAVVIGVRRETLENFFEEVTEAAVAVNEVSTKAESQRRIYVCRRPKSSLVEIWPTLRNYS